MATKQMSFIVSKRRDDENTKALNKLLEEGWRVHSTCAMSGADTYSSNALVILEKEEDK